MREGSAERPSRTPPSVSSLPRDRPFHHERFDGGGYPAGVSGPEIPIGARIFAVVDVFDALTTDRPYRPAMSYGEAATRIANGRGSHFDPAVVDAFLRIQFRIWEQIALRNGVVLKAG